jgi:hypothetical protein
MEAPDESTKSVRVSIQPRLEGLSGELTLFDDGAIIYIDLGCKENCGLELKLQNGILLVDVNRHKTQ